MSDMRATTLTVAVKGQLGRLVKDATIRVHQQLVGGIALELNGEDRNPDYGSVNVVIHLSAEQRQALAAALIPPPEPESDAGGEDAQGERGVTVDGTFYTWEELHDSVIHVPGVGAVEPDHPDSPLVKLGLI